MAEKNDIVNEKKKKEAEVETVDSVKGQIVSTLLLMDPDYSNIKKDNPDKVLVLYGKYKMAVDQTIAIACGKIQESLPVGASLPQGIDFLLAKKLLKAVEQRGEKGVEEVKNNDKILREVVEIPSLDRDTMDAEDSLPQAFMPKEMVEGILAEIGDKKNEIAPIVFGKAHSKDATESEKQMPGAMMYSDKIDDLISCGLSFEELEDDDKWFVIATIKRLQENGYDDIANQYTKLLRMSEDELKKEPEVECAFELDTFNPNEDVVTRRVRKFSEKLTNYFKYPQKATEGRFDEILKQIDEEELGVDSIFDFLATSEIREKIDFKDPKITRILEYAIERIGDNKRGLDLDGYLSGNLIQAAYYCKDVQPELGRKLISALNEKLNDYGKKEIIFNFDDIKKIKKDDIEEISKGLVNPKNNTVEYIYNQTKEISKDDRVDEGKKKYSEKEQIKSVPVTVENIKLNKYENFKRSISNMEKATGREKVYSFVSSTIEKRPEEREELFDAFLDFEAATRTSDFFDKTILDMQEKLYRKMLGEEFRNSAIYSKMLENLLAVPGNSQNVGLIMEISEIKKRIPESHDLVQPIEEYKKENRDDGEEPEGP